MGAIYERAPIFHHRPLPDLLSAHAYGRSGPGLVYWGGWAHCLGARTEQPLHNSDRADLDPVAADHTMDLSA